VEKIAAFAGKNLPHCGKLPCRVNYLITTERVFINHRRGLGRAGAQTAQNMGSVHVYA
jgi:hypothetical protein